MTALTAHIAIDRHCSHNWRRASKNTAWCRLGCAIGDFGAIAVFRFTGISWPTLNIMVLAIVGGLLTSIALESFIPSRQTEIGTAIGMSFISMEAMMNAVGWAVLAWWVAPIMLAAGFVTPLPGNYWRLKALGKACH